MKGPGLRISIDVRRVWRCPQCGQHKRRRGSVTALRCDCTDEGVHMTLLDDGRHGRPVEAGFVRPPPTIIVEPESPPDPATAEPEPAAPAEPAVTEPAQAVPTAAPIADAPIPRVPQAVEMAPIDTKPTDSEPKPDVSSQPDGGGDQPRKRSRRRRNRNRGKDQGPGAAG